MPAMKASYAVMLREAKFAANTSTFSVPGRPSPCLTTDAMAVESAFYGKNVRTTVVLSHARGVILLAAEQAGVTIAEYSPAQVKKTVVGRGAALKPQVGYMVAQLLRLRTPPQPADAADGVAVALTHLVIATRQATFYRIADTLLPVRKAKWLGLVQQNGVHGRVDPADILLMRTEFEVVVVAGFAFFWKKANHRRSATSGRKQDCRSRSDYWSTPATARYG